MLTDGTYVELPRGFDVVHKPGCLVCVDALGASLVSFFDKEVLAYTLNSTVAEQMQDPSCPMADLEKSGGVWPKHVRRPRGLSAHRHAAAQADSSGGAS